MLQVIVAGSAERVEKSMKMADRYREDLLKRGVLVIPLVWSGQQGEPPKKKGFGSLQKPAMVRAIRTSTFTWLLFCKSGKDLREYAECQNVIFCTYATGECHPLASHPRLFGHLKPFSSML